MAVYFARKKGWNGKVCKADGAGIQARHQRGKTHPIAFNTEEEAVVHTLAVLYSHDAHKNQLSTLPKRWQTLVQALLPRSKQGRTWRASRAAQGQRQGLPGRRRRRHASSSRSSPRRASKSMARRFQERQPRARHAVEPRPRSRRRTRTSKRVKRRREIPEEPPPPQVGQQDDDPPPALASLVGGATCHELAARDVDRASPDAALRATASAAAAITWRPAPRGGGHAHGGGRLGDAL